MNIAQAGLLARANAPINYTANSDGQLDLTFLNKFMRKMEAPTVSEIVFHFNGSGTVTGGSGGATAEDQYDLIRSLNVQDRGGYLYQDVAGKTLRIIEQWERGDRQVDRGALASGATSGAHDIFIRCILDIDEQGKRSKDYRIPLLHFTEGGQVDILFGAPAATTIPSGGATYRMHTYFRLHDERVREAKSRMVWRERSITNTSDLYDIDASLRAAFITSDLGGTTAYTDLSALVSLNSEALEFPAALDTQLLIDGYRQQKQAPAADDEVLASTTRCLPLHWPDRMQNIGSMPLIDSLDINDLASVPTSAKLVTCSIRDRVGSLAAEWMGYGSVEDYVAALRQAGMVKIEGGAKVPVSNFDPKLVRRLPVRIPIAA